MNFNACPNRPRDFPENPETDFGAVKVQTFISPQHYSEPFGIGQIGAMPGNLVWIARLILVLTDKQEPRGTSIPSSPWVIRVAI